MKLATHISMLLFLFFPFLAATGQNSFIATSQATYSSIDYFESVDTILYIPVCGADGKTYLNEIEARLAGVTTWAKCKCDSYKEVKIEKADMAWIERIVVNDMESTEQIFGQAYEDHSNIIFELWKADQNSLSLAGANGSGDCQMEWSVWIDFNENHLFESGEQVFEGSAAQEEVILNLPKHIQQEFITRMRVVWTQKGNHGSAKIAIGEVKDYAVYIR